jgi:membrane protease YdiL (CAAX protease family)
VLNLKNGRTLLAFFGMSFLIPWGIWIYLAVSGRSSQVLFWVAGFGPTWAALLLTVLQGGWRTLGQFLKGIYQRRAPWRWYVFSLLGTPLVMLLGLGSHILLGGARPQFLDPNHLVTSWAQLPGILIVFVYVFVFTALGEEPGWRGFALPRLQANFSPFLSSLILGLTWACWHLPLFWVAGNFHQDLPVSWFMLQVTGSTFLYTWMYNRTRGDLLTSLIFHTASNAAVGLLPILPLDNGGSLRPLWLVVGILWLMVSLVLVLDRKIFFQKRTIPEARS